MNPLACDICITHAGGLPDDGFGADGNGEGLLALTVGACSSEADGAVHLFFRRLFSDYLRFLCSEKIDGGTDMRGHFFRFRPGGQEICSQAMVVSPLEGGESFRPQFLLRFYAEAREAMALRGIRRRKSKWQRDLGCRRCCRNIQRVFATDPPRAVP